MKGDEKFWSVFWAIMAVTVVCLTLTTSSHYKHYNETVASAIVNGANPIALNCALEDSMGDSPTCVILTTKGDF